MDQKAYNSLNLYIKNRKYPSGSNKNQKDALRRKSKNFIIKEDVLLYHDRKKNVDSIKHDFVLFGSAYL